MNGSIHVVGIGLDGAAGLTDAVQQIVQQATVLVGSDRHLAYFPVHGAQRIVLQQLGLAIVQVQQILTAAQPEGGALIVVLTSGDPLFFGFGRLLLAAFPPELLTFHPHITSVQLAFSRIKVAWQDAVVVSAHGRSLETLTQALHQGKEKIAVLTDNTNTPEAIAQHLLGLDLPSRYELWVCENLGGTTEKIQAFTPASLIDRSRMSSTQPVVAPLVFSPLNVVILLRSSAPPDDLNLAALPLFGLADACFLSFSDRPSLITKREVRMLILGELALQPYQVVWDIGAGTGSVSIEIARLCPTAEIYAIEQTTAGITLIQQNSQRFQIKNVIPVEESAPGALVELPDPDRIFIGGSGGHLADILTLCGQRLRPQGVMVLAIATLEHLTTVIAWLQQSCQSWQHDELQIQLARSVPISHLTRFSPLNPVTLVKLTKK